MPDAVTEYYAPGSLSVAFYDLLAALSKQTLDGDIDFYARHLRRPEARVLELGCGTGRVALALAGQGFAVTGIDLSPAMLAHAVARHRAADPAVAARLRFHTGDMTTLDLAERFDGVIIPFYGFSHLAGPDQRAGALATIARHLRPDGRAVIHAPRPETLSTPIDPESLQRNVVTVRLDAAGHELRVRVLARSVDAEHRLNTQDVDYQVSAPDGRVLRRSIERFRYQWFDDAELDALARAAGLTLTGVKSSFIEGRDGIERIYLLEPGVRTGRTGPPETGLSRSTP